MKDGLSADHGSLIFLVKENRRSDSTVISAAENIAELQRREAALFFRKSFQCNVYAIKWFDISLAVTGAWPKGPPPIMPCYHRCFEAGASWPGIHR